MELCLGCGVRYQAYLSENKCPCCMRKSIYTEEYLKQLAGLQNAALNKQIQGGDFGGNAYGGNAYQQSCRCPYCGRWK